MSIYTEAVDVEQEVGVVSGPCEDAPCCGCCGPHSGGYGDPYAHDHDMESGWDDRDDPDYEREIDNERDLDEYESGWYDGMEDAGYESALFGEC